MSNPGEEKAKSGGFFGRFKNATQSISKIWTKHERSRDPQLEARVEQTEDVRRRYAEINKTLQTMVLQYAALGKTHASLANQLEELAQREEGLQGSINRTANLHDTLGMRTDPLIVSLKPVTHGLSTLCDKTIGDAMQSVRMWQHALGDFDAYRAELESPGISPTQEQEAHLVDLQHRLDKARENVWVKLDLLHEHRALVVDQYMGLLHDAFRQFYSLERGDDHLTDEIEPVHVPGWSPRPVFNQPPSKKSPPPHPSRKSDAVDAAKPDEVQPEKAHEGVAAQDKTIKALDAIADKPDRAHSDKADEGAEAQEKTIKASDTIADKPDAGAKTLKKRVSFSSLPNSIIDSPSNAADVTADDAAED